MSRDFLRKIFFLYITVQVKMVVFTITHVMLAVLITIRVMLVEISI